MIAAVLTVVALPFLWSSKKEQSGAESVAAIAATGGVGEAAAPGLDPAEPAILDALTITAVPAAASLVDDGIVTIDVAPPKGQRTEAVKLPWYQRLSVYRYRMANEWQRLTNGLATWLRHSLQG